MFEAKFFLNKNSDFPNMIPVFRFVNPIEAEKYWMFGELIFFTADYVLNYIVPNMEKIWRGELIPQPNSEEDLVDWYKFGYEATIVEFRRNGPSIVWYEYGDKSLEVPSADVYKFMMDWAKAIRKWEECNNKSNEQKNPLPKLKNLFLE